jgi:hypothetical protein
VPSGPDAKPQPEPSQRKLKGLARLQGLPVKVSQGEGYELHHHLIAGVTLDRVRQDLSAIQGLLADAVIEERAR